MSVDDVFAEFAEAEEKPKEEKPVEPEKPVEAEKPVETEKVVVKPEKVEESKSEAEKKSLPPEDPQGEVQKKEEPSASDDFFGDAVEAPAKEEPKAEELKPTPKPMTEEKFDASDAKPTKKKGHMYYGAKGEGKTTLAFSHPGKIYCLSFDQASMDIKESMFNNDPRIKVKDGIKYLSKVSGEAWIESADKCFRYLNFLLTKDAKEFEPDWIVIDGLEILVRDICEKTMRWRNNLMVFQPFNLILWQERNMYVDQIHMLGKRIAKEGIIYTAYIDTRAIKIEGGKIVEMKREPKWAADVKKQVQTVIRAEAKETPDGREFYGIVESSKTKGIKTGVRASVFWDIETQKGGIANILEASK